MKNVGLIILFTIFFFPAFAQKYCDTTVIRVNADTFQIMLQKNDGVILDVRTRQEWKTGCIKGAVNIDYRSSDFEKKINKLDKSKTYYVYCEVGGRSNSAAKYMKSQGFCRVIVMQRGLHEWKEKNYPLVMP